jgi:pimeloyl-ACP methyl ester carboxylesterase
VGEGHGLGRRTLLRAGVGLGAAVAAGVGLGTPKAHAAPVYTATLGGVSIDYVWAGAPLSRSIVFVHGGAHASWCWANQLQYFAARGWNCYALNWYNHGASQDLPTSTFASRSIAAVVQEIWYAVLFTGTLCPVLVGHSMGALAAQRYASLYSVRGLSLLAPVAPQEVGNAYVPIPVEPGVPWGPPPFEAAQHMFFGGLSLAAAQSYYAQLCPESGQAILEATDRAGVSVSSAAVRARAPHIQVIAAQDDALTPPDVTAEVATYYQAGYHLLPGESHSGMLLGPNWTAAAQLLHTFVEGC